MHVPYGNSMQGYAGPVPLMPWGPYPRPLPLHHPDPNMNHPGLTKSPSTTPHSVASVTQTSSSGQTKENDTASSQDLHAASTNKSPDVSQVNKFSLYPFHWDKFVLV